MITRLIAALAALTPAAAAAQSLSAGAEATTDERRRGLSWSDGQGALSADVAARSGVIDGSLRVVTTRGADRHAGADAVADAALGVTVQTGGVELRARGIGHFFAGAAIGADYYEAAADASYTLGPAQLVAGVAYAPDQRAIGGDNLYLHAGASAGIPATPLTVSAGIGHSSGATDEPFRAARLRPGGDYTDWRVGADYVIGPVTLGVDYVGTDVDRRAALGLLADRRHSDDRILGRVRIGL